MREELLDVPVPPTVRITINIAIQGQGAMAEGSRTTTAMRRRELIGEVQSSGGTSPSVRPAVLAVKHVAKICVGIGRRQDFFA